MSAQYAAARLAQKGSLFFLILLYGGFFLRAFLWVEILRDMRLISAYSISSLSYLIIPVFSCVMLGEDYKITKLLGGLFILSGIFIFSWGEQKLNQLQPEIKL